MGCADVPSLAGTPESAHLNTNLSILAGRVPWWGKIVAKLILSRLPAEYRTWKRLGLFQHGQMEEPAYAYGVFKKHFDRVKRQLPCEGFVGLELGPGDSLLTAMVAHAFGASAYYLIDVGAFAQAELKPYHAMAKFLDGLGLTAPKIEGARSLESVLSACGATYGTSGLASLRSIPDRYIDFIFSQTVLQHLRRADFLETMYQMRRVLRSGGVCSHVVDLRDMLGGSLNNLRFPERVWESHFMAESGFYTNRIRYSEMLALFARAGFRAKVVAKKYWDRLPIPRSKMVGPFRYLPEEELRVSGFEVVLQKN